MKKVFMIIASCAFIFSACSDKEVIDNNLQPQQGTVSFTVTTKNALDSRASLYSQESVHNVSIVNVYAFKEIAGIGYQYLSTIPITWPTPGLNTGTVTLSGASMLTAGNYKFIAVGRGVSDTFTFPSSGTVLFEQFLVNVADASQVGEIFSGIESAAVVDNGDGFRVEIIITRNIAGVLGYFSNIPADVNGQTVGSLRLTVSNANLGLNLSDGTTSNPLANTYSIINVDLSGREVVDGVFAGNTAIPGVTQLPGSQLSGAFALPINGVTMTLGLYGTDGTLLKSWPITDSSTGSTTINLNPNEFYSFGQKLLNDHIYGEDDDPATDPGDNDTTIDLMTDQAITVTVSSDWGATHNLVIQ